MILPTSTRKMSSDPSKEHGNDLELCCTSDDINECPSMKLMMYKCPMSDERWTSALRVTRDGQVPYK